MSNTSNTNNNSSVMDLEFDGYDANVRKNNAFKKKIEDIKSKISSSITKNINYENGKSQLSTSFKILEDTDTHTLITLRCGSNKIFQNTTKLNQYTHIQILNSLQAMLDSGKLDEYVTAYAKGNPLVEKTTSKKSKKSSTKSKKTSAA